MRHIHFLCLTWFFLPLVARAEPGSSLKIDHGNVAEVLRKWEDVFYYPRAGRAAVPEGKEEKLGSIRNQLPDLIESVKAGLLSDQLNDAPAYITLLRIRARLTGTMPQPDDIALQKAAKAVLTSGKAGSGVMLGLAAEAIEWGVKLDIDSQLLRKSAAKLGCPASLSHVMWGRDFLESRVELADSMEYYTFGIVYFSVETALRGYPTGFDDYCEAGEAARKDIGTTSELERLTRAEKDAAAILGRVDWDKLRNECLYLMDYHGP